MKMTEPTIEFLGKTSCADNGIFLYKKGHELVDFFVEFGADDFYGEGFYSHYSKATIQNRLIEYLNYISS